MCEEVFLDIDRYVVSIYGCETGGRSKNQKVELLVWEKDPIRKYLICMNAKCELVSNRLNTTS